ncbi:MAG: hypothetical protein KDD82_14515 [Planctomycetes bacterium]|nr:hypothetical protein [Planctomycetota bacterium]
MLEGCVICNAVCVVLCNLLVASALAPEPQVGIKYFDDYGNAVDEGKLPVVASAVGVELGFQGRRLDAETGLYYYRNRMYDPQTGRFLQTDPVWDAGNVGNPYTFCWSNPTSLFDAQGTFASLVLRTTIRASMRQALRGASIRQAARQARLQVEQLVTDRLMFLFMDHYGPNDLDIETLLGDGALSQIVTTTADVTNSVSMDVYNFVGESFENCFLAGTLVDTTTRGRVRVEEVQEGDHIAPPPGHEGCTNPRCGRVEQLFRNVTSEVLTITAVTRPRARERRTAAAGGGGEESAGEDGEPPSASQSQTIRCTPGHPFFVEGRGWVFAGDLRVGDVFEARGERVEVGAVETRAEQAQTFNFEVACHHTYFVSGAQGPAGADSPAVLVHNVSRIGGKLRSLKKRLSPGKLAKRERKLARRRVGKPSEIRFTQPTVSPHFSRGGDVSDAIAGLKSGRLSPESFPPIRVVSHQGSLFSLDNRRLLAFKSAKVPSVPIERVSLQNPAIAREFGRKFNPIRGQGNIIVVASRRERPEALELLLRAGLIE